MKNSSFSRSFANAFSGLKTVFKVERNIKIQAFIGLAAIAAGIFFKISKVEMLIVMLCCMAVISLEIVNSAIERVVDLASPQYNELAKYAKDFAAGAVLYCSICASIIGLIIFVPYLIEFTLLHIL